MRSVRQWNAYGIWPISTTTVYEQPEQTSHTRVVKYKKSGTAFGKKTNLWLYVDDDKTLSGGRLSNA